MPTNTKAISFEDLKYYDSRRRTEVTKEITDATKNKVDKVEGKGLSTNDLTDELLEKLNAAGTSDFSGSYNDLTDKPTDATESKSGFMTADMVQKLDGIEENANNYVHPTATAAAEGLYKVTVDGLGHVVKTAAVSKDDITGLGIPAQDTTYNVATATKDGLMASDDKVKLDGIADGAQANVIEKISVNGTAQTITDKGVNISVPTKVSQLTNDSDFQTADEVESTVTGKGYQTAAQVETAITGKGYQTADQVNSAINDKIGAIQNFKVVDELPAVGEKNVIYLVPKADGKNTNVKDEYVYVDGTYELVGDTAPNLDDYWNTSNLTFATFADIDTIFDGE